MSQIVDMRVLHTHLVIVVIQESTGDPGGGIHEVLPGQVGASIEAGTRRGLVINGVSYRGMMAVVLLRTCGDLPRRPRRGQSMER